MGEFPARRFAAPSRARVPGAGLATALMLALLAGSAQAGDRAPTRGVAFLASWVGKDTTLDEIHALVDGCRLDLVVVDFTWITHVFPDTDLAAVEQLARSLRPKGVDVAVMYRPRALTPSDADVHFARDRNGAVAESHLNLCLAHEDSVAWGASWGETILRACPSVGEVILYNLDVSCRCDRCRDGKAREHARRFLETCRARWCRIRPDVRVGHVGRRLDYREALDRCYPFLGLNRQEIATPMDVSGRVRAVRDLCRDAGEVPAVPLLKVAWADATRNTTADIVAAIEACEREKLGFLLWYYEWIFRMPGHGYEPAPILRALGGDPGKLGPSPAADGDGPPLDALRAVSFGSRESSVGPRLRLEDSAGRVETLEASADTMLSAERPDTPMGKSISLGLNLADRHRALVGFPAGGPRRIARATLLLRVRPSAFPVLGRYELALHRVVEPWSEVSATWSAHPAFDEKPLAVVTTDPLQADLAIDVTSWARRRGSGHGLLLRVARPVPSGPWTQPDIRTGTPFSESIPWVATLEDALDQARASGRPVLATVVAVRYEQYTSGYRAAAEVWKGLKEPAFGDGRSLAIDDGLVAERAMMYSLFTDPEIVHLVKEHFVAVRVRPYVLAFDEGGSRKYPDPLRALGTSAPEIGSPALVFVRPEGTLLHACRRMGVLSVPMVRDMLMAVLRKAGVDRPATFPDRRPAGLREAWTLAREGRFENALAKLEALGVSRRSPWRFEAMYLKAHLLDRRGSAEEARSLWRSAVDGDPEGPWGSKSAVRLMERELRLDAWESFHGFPCEPLVQGTEVGAGDLGIVAVMERAVDYLLLQQRADGGFPDAFHDVSSGSGPGSKWDYVVPRTALATDALLGVRRHLPSRGKELDDAVARGIEVVGRFSDDPEALAWQATYALHLQVAILRSDLPEGAKADARGRARKLMGALETIRHDGGWSYMPPPRIHSFNTAPVLLLLAELDELGVVSPPGMRADAARFLESLRFEDEPRNFAYATTVRHASVRASSCRTALCELALLTHRGDGETSRLRAGIELFFEHEPAARRTTKVFESNFSPVAMHDAYHYYFGHYYVARALARLPHAEAAAHAKRQKEIVLSQRELDGSFVDSPKRGKCYSTAMALLTLVEDLRYDDG